MQLNLLKSNIDKFLDITNFLAKIKSMNLKVRQLKQICHPLWQYLKQPVFQANSESIWSISRFWYLYKIQFLKNCWEKECNEDRGLGARD